jgi:hypothetical protein
MARQCLLAEDAMTLVEYDPEVLPYKKVFYQSQVSPTSDNYYEKYLDDIRSLILSLLLERRYPLRTRLFFTVYFIMYPENWTGD